MSTVKRTDDYAWRKGFLNDFQRQKSKTNRVGVGQKELRYEKLTTMVEREREREKGGKGGTRRGKADSHQTPRGGKREKAAKGKGGFFRSLVSCLPGLTHP